MVWVTNVEVKQTGQILFSKFLSVEEKALFLFLFFKAGEGNGEP